MTVKVRSSEGEQLSNDSTPDINSPSSITAGDLIVIVWCFNDDLDPASGLTPPSGFTLHDEVFDAGVGDRGMRYAVWSRIASADDNTNEGVANYYTFTGMGGGTDILYGIFSLYDDGAATVSYQASSLAHTFQDDVGSTATNAPTQTITNNGSLALCGWAGRQGADPYNIQAGEAYSPTGGANAAFYHDGWTSDSLSGLSWVVGTAEFDTADSPIGVQTVTHVSCSSDVDFYSVSMIFETAGGGILLQAMNHYRNNGKFF